MKSILQGGQRGLRDAGDLPGGSNPGPSAPRQSSQPVLPAGLTSRRVGGEGPSCSLCLCFFPGPPPDLSWSPNPTFQGLRILSVP